MNRRARFFALAAAGAAVAATAAWAAETITYTYDARGRLVKVVRTDAATKTVKTKAEYKYDKAENRTNVTVTSPNPPP